MNAVPPKRGLQPTDAIHYVAVQYRESKGPCRLLLEFCTQISLARASFCHSFPSALASIINEIVITWM
jgi:hypothetical protein